LRQAITLGLDNWRHHFRHAYVSWGEDRLRSVSRTLALQPALPFAHLLAAMAFIARGAFDAATEALTNGVHAGPAARPPRTVPPWACTRRSGVLAASGRRDEALAECA
jgi:hypothetical protein